VDLSSEETWTSGVVNWSSAPSDNHDESSEIVPTWSLNRPIQRIRLSGANAKSSWVVSEAERMAVVGPNQTLLSVFDLKTQKETWKAKNVPLDTLNMDVPIWDRDAVWLQEGRVVATSTAYGQVRIYDTRAQRPPVLDYNLLQNLRLQRGESKIQQLTQQDALVLNNLRVNPWAGNGRGTVLAVSSHQGHLFMLDLRRNWTAPGKVSKDVSQQPQLVARLKGSAGSIRDFQFHPTEPYLAAVGLDRYVRLYNAQAPYALVAAHYAKLRLNRISFAQLDAPKDGNEDVKVEVKEEFPEEEEKDEAQMNESQGTPILSAVHLAEADFLPYLLVQKMEWRWTTRKTRFCGRV